jgi:RNA polymerase sigma-70 factor, ECF subfamily
MTPAGATDTGNARLTDAERFERLYRENADRIYGLCLRLSGDRQRAAELVQDVFVRAWRKLHLLERDDDAGAWIWRVAKNVVFNDTRARRRRDSRFVLSSHLPAMEAIAVPGSADTPLPIRRMDLAAAIALLPERARAIYLLHDVDGFTTEEIAEQLGIAAGTVRAQLHRARGTLRQFLLP